ncbi:MAG: MOSC domain-containing protein [Ardenticatenaceae bacterium]|nr:MOSC domain-containing protein [Ardenticatenaceae bacterium]
MTTPLLLSIQVGRPRQLGAGDSTDAEERSWSSGIFKEPVAGAVWLGRINLAGDDQADRKHHGGPDKAVLAYAAEHYSSWRQELSQLELPYGAFGENFTIDGLTETEVCLGDVYAIGAAQVQVSQPRQPCWKLARRWGIKDLTAQVEETGRTGWYLRVLVEGYVQSGAPVELLERPHPEWTIARAAHVMRHLRDDREAAAELAACALLSSTWRGTIIARLELISG